MKPRSIGCWATAGPSSLALAASGVTLPTRQAPRVAGCAPIGYPLSLMTAPGAWRPLGVDALAWPGLPRLEGSAAASLALMLTGARAPHRAGGDPRPGSSRPSRCWRRWPRRGRSA